MRVIEYFLSNNFTKVVVVTDGDVDIANPEEVWWALATRVRPNKDLIVREHQPGLSIDPSSVPVGETDKLGRTVASVSKMGFDATKPLGELERYKKIDVPAEVMLKVSKMMEGIS